MQYKSTNKLICYIFLVSFFITQSPIVNAETNNANISLVLDKSTFLNKEIIAFDVVLNSNFSSINALDSRLSFNPEKIELISANASSSLCSLFIAETINNKIGQYQIICGSKQKETTNNIIVTLTFKKLEKGLTQINISPDSQVLLNDGFGTNLPVTSEIYNVFIVK